MEQNGRCYDPSLLTRGLVVLVVVVVIFYEGKRPPVVWSGNNTPVTSKAGCILAKFSQYRKTSNKRRVSINAGLQLHVYAGSLV